MESLKSLLPYNWESRNGTMATTYVELDKDSDEFKQIEKDFILKHPKCKRIQKMDRIENKHAYMYAMIEKEKMIFHHKINPVETVKDYKICQTCKKYMEKKHDPNDYRRNSCSNCATDSHTYLICGHVKLPQKTFLYPKYIVTTEAAEPVNVNQKMLEDLFTHLDNFNIY